MKLTSRHYCFLVGFLHLMLIVLRLYERIWELIVLEEPIVIREQMFLFFSYIFQIVTVSLLIYGTANENPKFSIPWLLITTPAFIIVTLYGLNVIFKEEAGQVFYNFLSMGAIWIMWYTVLKYNIQKSPFFEKIKYVRLISK
ncbi:uncharacterized protein LOC130904065 [Diorhabda carinulata]|uniref:uncharacterized protein LOC130904065 n=1 Tax=Diorhabda carinulata TaxID=1163345 RepID=UPI0025A2CBAD|nr:uncharacterized protein LOC130904065 [Diorhabda carinulata]